MRVIYADAIFLRNALLDYCVLLGTAAVAGVGIRRGRFLLGALLGGLYALFAALGGGIWAEPGAAAICGLLLGAWVFRGQSQGLRLPAVLGAVACGFAGAASFGLWPGFGAGLLLIRLLLRGSLAHQLRGEIVPLRVTYRGREVAFPALVDTGNSLFDPETGAPVTLVDAAALRPLGTLPLFPLAVRTAAGDAVLGCFRPDALTVAGVLQPQATLALSQGHIATGRGYAALTHAAQP